MCVWKHRYGLLRINWSKDGLVLRRGDIRLPVRTWLEAVSQSDSCLLALFVCHLNVISTAVLILLFCTVDPIQCWAASDSVASLCAYCVDRRCLIGSHAVILKKWSSSIRQLMSPHIPAGQTCLTAAILKDGFESDSNQPQAQAETVWDVCLFCIL